MSMIKEVWRDYKDLVILMGGSVLAVIAMLLPYSLVRLVLAGGFILYAPGYALLAALYPKQTPLNTVQRLTASVGMSVVVSSLLALIITYTLGTTLVTISSTLGLWILSLACIAAYRRSQCAASERFAPAASALPAWQALSKQRKGIILAQLGTVLILLMAAGRLLHISRRAAPQFAEFYLLGQDGRAGAYTEALTANTPHPVTVGVIHHGTPTDYQIFYTTDNTHYETIAAPLLHDGEKWESSVALVLPASPRFQKVTFALHKPGEPLPYRKLYVWAYVE
jgi:uncharacterized membrane protein